VTGFLLDTNVLSEFSRSKPANSRVDAWLKALPDEILFASVLTFAEIRRGIELLPAGKRRTQLERPVRILAKTSGQNCRCGYPSGILGTCR